MRKSPQIPTNLKTSWLPLIASVLTFASALANAQTAISTTKLGPDKTAVQQASPSTSEARISELIEQLDNRDFDRREQAVDELQKFGAEAVKPLALKSLDCTPEASWRIKKTLEAICTSSDEATLYQIVGILRIRYHNNSQPFKLEHRLQQLKIQWEQQRKMAAITSLRNSGLDVVAPQAENPQLLAAHVIRREFLTVNAVPTQAIQVKQKSRQPKLSKSEMRSQIDRLLESDIETNRKLAFKSNRPDPASLDPANINAVLIDESFGLKSDFVTVRFPKNWKGTADDLKPLNNILGLDEVVFENQNVSAELIDAIANHSDKTLAKITFNDCQIDAAKLGTASWPASLNTIEFINQQTTPELLESTATIKSLKTLSFQKCDIAAEALTALKPLTNLRSLAFSEMEISGPMFDAFGDLERIVRIDMAVCKFRPEHYRKLVRRRKSTIEIDFSAQAFLGVRGLTSSVLVEPPAIAGPVPGIKLDLPKSPDGAIVPKFDRPAELPDIKVEIGPDGFAKIIEKKRDSKPAPKAIGCRITDVISGSGADKAGLRANDVIEKIDGEPIVQFNDLRLHIAQYRAGDRITLDIRRSGKPLELKVKLTAPDPMLR